MQLYGIVHNDLCSIAHLIFDAFEVLKSVFFIFLVSRGCPSQLACISTNPTGPEVNDHVRFQWPSYEQPQGSNL